jgi:hypothetical protein
MDEDRDLQLRWAAGFFDGEGTVVLGSSGGKIYCRIMVFQRWILPLLRFASLWPGTVIKASGPRNKVIKSKGGFIWDVSGDAAYKAARELVPYSVLKKDELALVVALGAQPWRYSRASGKFIARSPEQKRADLEIINQMKEMKDGWR